MGADLARGGADAVEGVEEAAEAERRLGVLACPVPAEERVDVLDHHDGFLRQRLPARAAEETPKAGGRGSSGGEYRLGREGRKMANKDADLIECGCGGGEG
jgi:hypothetical protein